MLSPGFSLDPGPYLLTPTPVQLDVGQQLQQSACHALLHI
jgi:hypothetical protein